MKKILTLTCSILLSLCASIALAISADDFVFDDQPTSDLVTYPDWFKQNFLELDEDLAEANKNGKTLIAYFGQKRCAYCKKLMETNFKLPDIVKYTREHFDIVPLDIWSPEEMTTPKGDVVSERDYSISLNTNFTPSLVFYRPNGDIALRLRGYYPAYQFRAALEYVADEHYLVETFPDYLARGDSTLRFEADDMVEEPFFEKPPFHLDRSVIPGSKPLAVFFEQGNCHACDILHTDPLRKQQIQRRMEQFFDSVQLDMWSDTPVVTPSGTATTAKQWAKDLGLFYAPSILFFDERGQEILRIDSVVQFVRLRNVLNYISSKAYLREKNYLVWSAKTRRLIDEMMPRMPIPLSQPTQPVTPQQPQ